MGYHDPLPEGKKTVVQEINAHYEGVRDRKHEADKHAQARYRENYDAIFRKPTVSSDDWVPGDELADGVTYYELRCSCGGSFAISLADLSRPISSWPSGSHGSCELPDDLTEQCLKIEKLAAQPDLDFT